MIQFSTSDYSAAIGLPLWITSGAAGVLGVVIGSFLNVVIHRVPAGESIIFPTSRCPACGTNIRPYDNIPVLSYMILGGKCRACKSGISIRYPLVELATGLLFAATAYFRGVGLNTPFDLALTATLVALVFIDAEHMILPNAITYPGICVALISRILIPLAG